MAAKLSKWQRRRKLEGGYDGVQGATAMLTCPKFGNRNAWPDANSPAPERLSCPECWYGLAVTWAPLDEFKPPDQQRKPCSICKAGGGPAAFASSLGPDHGRQSGR
jgi:hypothetical protein